MVSSILLLLFFSTLAQASTDPEADPAQLLILKLDESDRLLVDGEDVNIQVKVSRCQVLCSPPQSCSLTRLSE